MVAHSLGLVLGSEIPPEQLPAHGGRGGAGRVRRGVALGGLLLQRRRLRPRRSRSPRPSGSPWAWASSPRCHGIPRSWRWRSPPSTAPSPAGSCPRSDSACPAGSTRWGSSRRHRSGRCGTASPSSTPCSRGARRRRPTPSGRTTSGWCTRRPTRSRCRPGVSGPKMLQLSGELAHGTLLSVLTGTDYLAWAREQIDKGRARSAEPERPHRITTFALCAVDEDSSVAKANARQCGRVLPRGRRAERDHRCVRDQRRSPRPVGRGGPGRAGGPDAGTLGRRPGRGRRSR